ncbi:MAG: hypothetical protein M3N19_04495 [Candidatus Eremiobacteraeota bacterium]|nr:hypothetical protein [Candidatus Eremiobacteraeota bacterium]
MPRIVAHLIVGAKPEPFLPAMLSSIAGCAQHLFVNENSGLGDDAPNLNALRASIFAQENRLTIARTTFTTFADARNVCFDLDARADERTWIIFIDADEVHGKPFAQIGSKLDRLAPSIGFVDAYTWHFFGTYDWYTSIERRLMFHRWTPRARWHGEVHERLTGVPEGRIALPYVYAHYGNVMPFSEYARKGAQYSSLGAAGTPLSPQDAHAADFHGDMKAVEEFFTDKWPSLLHFSGLHPQAARSSIAFEIEHKGAHFKRVDAIIRKHQPAIQRFKNTIMKLNYEQRWRARAIAALRYSIR